MKKDTEYYCHVFANSVQGAITLNQGSYSGNATSSAIAALASIIKETLRIPSPTLYSGKTYIAAKFGTEWQGMNIRKE